MKIAIYVTSQQKGFLVSLGKVLSRDHEVVFWARDKFVARVVDDIAPELSRGMTIMDAEAPSVAPESAVEMALEREKRYKTTMSMLISHDRALGKGYIFNADRHPDIKRSNWGHERKLASVLELLVAQEQLFDKDAPDVVLALNHDKAASLVAEDRGVLYLSLHPARFGSRLLWSDDDYMTSSSLVANVKRFLDEPKPCGEHLNYVQDSLSQHFHNQVGYTYETGIKRAILVAINDTKQLLRGTRKKDSYGYLSWIPSCIRKPYIFNFFSKHGKTPEQLAGYKTVYFPLQLEPEISILSLSPEFNNSMEMIAWLSKSLPADTVIVIKEQPFSYGIRSRKYYEYFLKMGNVFLARPELSSWDWVKSSTFTATITGTVGVEAVYFHKPVLTFGKHHIVNHLPTVRHVDRFGDLSTAVPELMALSEDRKALEHSAQALCNAQIASSFELDTFKKLYKSSALHEEEAAVAAANLRESYPNHFAAAAKPSE